MGPLPPAMASQIAACATRDTTAPARLRELTRIAEGAYPSLGGFPEHRPEFLYCMVVNSTAAVPSTTQPEAQMATMQRVEELLTVLREEAGGMGT